MGGGRGNKIEETNIHALIENAQKQIYDEPNLSSGMKALFELLIGVIQILDGKRLAKIQKTAMFPHRWIQIEKESLKKNR